MKSAHYNNARQPRRTPRQQCHHGLDGIMRRGKLHLGHPNSSNPRKLRTTDRVSGGVNNLPTAVGFFDYEPDTVTAYDVGAKKCILVSGASGQLGQLVVKALIARGIPPRKLRTAAIHCAAQVPGHIRVQGVDVMSKKNRSFLVCIALSSSPSRQRIRRRRRPRRGRSQAVKQELWSDPATWPDQKVPRAGRQSHH